MEYIFFPIYFRIRNGGHFKVKGSQETEIIKAKAKNKRFVKILSRHCQGHAVYLLYMCCVASLRPNKIICVIPITSLKIKVSQVFFFLIFV